MVTELRTRSQITLPSKITKSLNVNEGDLFEIFIKDGGIFLCPVETFPKSELSDLREKLLSAEEKRLSGQKTYSISEVSEHLKEIING